MANVKTVDERNYGVDALKILAMFFVVILHTLGHGGVLANVPVDSVQYKFFWCMEIVAYVAVDVFALISGYVSYHNQEKKINYTNYFKLWLQVVFFNILITIMFNIVNPSMISVRNYLFAFTPVSNNLYWYFTAYTGLFLLMPLINKGIRNCNEETLKKIFIIIILGFSCFEVVAKNFVLSSGYSVIWIVLLYILGAIIKKCKIGNNLKLRCIIITICILYLTTFIWKIYGFKINKLNISIDNNLFIDYISPTILFNSILFLIAFSRLKINNNLKCLIKFMVPSAFAIYLVNDNYLVRENIVANIFADMTNNSIIHIFLVIISCIIIFSFVAIFLDQIRIFIFDKLNIKKYSDKIINLLNRFITKISSIL